MSQARADATAGNARRDALGRGCFLLHFAIMLIIVTGWLAPWSDFLGFYLVFVPAVALQWQFNKNTCVLNNLESLLRHGRWRDSDNPEEGAWLLNLVKNAFGLQLRPRHMDVLVYAGLVALWGLGLVHFLHS